MKYEMVCGLETHVELATNTKIFCSCTTEFGGEQNTHCCPVCIGLPGTQPTLNKKVVEFAVKAGLATNCEINYISKMDRKNYCYPDLPKAYQISQYDLPICKNGFIELSSGKKIGITRIHIEEDAGKLIHQKGDTLIDYNRGGVPLVEIVTEPDISSIDEAREYLETLQSIMRYIEVSDCKMQEGSMRCDVNISLRPEGSDKLGTRTEIKNMNSFTFMEKAMEFEFNRQAEVLDSGEAVVQQTLRYITEEDRTEPMRSKEDADDYRYFREPDLVTIYVSEDEVKNVKDNLPELPKAKLARYVNELGLPEKDALQLVKYKKVALYFEEAIKGVKNAKSVANLIITQIFRRVETESEKEAFDIATKASQLSDLVKLLDEGKVQQNLIKSTLDKMLDSGKDYSAFLSEDDLAGMSEEELLSLCKNAIEANAKAVEDVKNGKVKAVGAIVGNVMKNSKGRADAKKAEEIVLNLING